MKACLRYEPEKRSTCEELMASRYFTEDGFISWFDEELKQMLERDAADFKMRQKKFRKSKGRADSRGNDSQADSRPQSQPPAAVPPPLPTKAQQQQQQAALAAQQQAAAQAAAQQQQEQHRLQQQLQQQQQQALLQAQAQHAQHQQQGESSYHPTGGDPVDDQAHDGHVPSLGVGASHYSSHAGSGGDLGGPPPLDLPNEGRRPATRGSECGGTSGAGDFGEEMPLLPNLQRPTTPRAQRLVAFPQLASALDGDQGPSGMGAHHSRGGSQWGNNDRSLGAAPPPPLGKGKAKYNDENERNVPSMPSLSQALAPSQAPPTFGGSNLPQLKEGQLFASELPDRYPGGGAGALSHAPVPASRGGGSKKKASAYDPSNPYFSKPSGKGKMKSSKASGSSSHGQSSLGSSGQMGVVGQAHSIAGLSAAYALPPSALPPRTPNHDYDLGPPRTPGEGSSSNQLNQLSIESGHQHQLGLGGGIGQSSHQSSHQHQQQSFGSTSGHGGYSQAGHGSHGLHSTLGGDRGLGGRGNYYGGGGHTLGGGHNLNSVQYSGGQYAKYGKRF